MDTLALCRFRAAQRFALLALEWAWTLLGSRRNSNPEELLENGAESSASSARFVGPPLTVFDILVR